MSRNQRLFLGFAAPALVIAVTVAVQVSRSGSGGARQERSAFNGDRAYTDLETVVAFGARPSGSPNLARTRSYIVSELEAAGFTPEIDVFAAETPVGEIEMANIRVVRPGRSGSGSIAIGGHYDTKRFDFNFLGANDGGSSTAVLLELARTAGTLDLIHDVEFLFFDGEEAILEWTATDGVYGSRHDVVRRFRGGTLQDLRALILIDMVGDRDLTVIQESASTLWLTHLIWDTATRLGYGEYFSDTSARIEDDHVPYLNAGIDAIDLIDFDYPYWHTPGDTLDKTSAVSLQVIGDVVYNALVEIDARLAP